MDTYIARQPIFDHSKRLYAYALLYRESIATRRTEVDEDRATSSLLSGTFLTEGLEKITSGKLCFIRFSEEMLLQDIAVFFPKNKMVIAIPGGISPSPEIISACENLVKQGYRLSFDHFNYHKKLAPLLDLVDIVALDFSQNPPRKIEENINRLSHREVKFLADGTTTYAMFSQADKMGFTYFQGDFFSHPEMLRVKELASLQHNLINLLAEVNQSNTTVDRLNQIISTDVGITYKLLRYINSAHFYLLREVTSVRQAIQYLGVNEIRRFVSLVIISELALDKPEELIRLSLVRARFCELLAQTVDASRDSAQFFLLGLFSLLEPLMDTPIAVIMEKLPLAEAMKVALVEQKGLWFPYLEAVTSYERGDLQKCSEVLREVGVDEEECSLLYMEAVQFAGSLMR